MAAFPPRDQSRRLDNSTDYYSIRGRNASRDRGMNNGSSDHDKSVNLWEELNRPKDRPEAPVAPRLPAPGPGPNPSGQQDTPPIVAIVGGILAVAVLGIAGFVVLAGGGGPSDEPTAAAPDQVALLDEDTSDSTESETTASDTSVPTTESGDPQPVDPGTPTEPGTEPPPDATDDVAYSPATPAGADDVEGYTVLSRGKLYLRGRLPNTLIEQGAVNALEQLMGPGNVVSEYVIDPDAPFEMGQAADVYIEDTVLFEFGSAEIAPDFYPLLQLGATLMQLQDGVTMEVYGHTDSDGSDETNLALSQARVDAVKAFYVDQGIDPDRVTAIGRGESEPVADNATADGRQQNRRVEVVINGFTFSL